jgi:hypothetical protein
MSKKAKNRARERFATANAPSAGFSTCITNKKVNL